jgi:AcrR family transcriptional regulator
MTDGRTRLLDSAERLFAERGVDGPSLREINTAAGQRNASGVQYHFGGRAGLLAAVIERHMSTIDAERTERLDALERRGDPSARELMATLVEPLASRLADPGGRRYLRILGELAAHPEADVLQQQPGGWNTSLRRTSRLLERSLGELPADIAAARAAHTTSFLLRALADQARRSTTDGLSDLTFTADLVDVLVAVLTAPMSTETRRVIGASG